MGLLEMGMKLPLKMLKDTVINPRLQGIGKVEDLSYHDRRLFARLRLEGLDDRPLEVTCEDIQLAEDGSWLRIGRFEANLKFMQTALDRYVAGQTIAVPEGPARTAVIGARKLLKL